MKNKIFYCKNCTHFYFLDASIDELDHEVICPKCKFNFGKIVKSKERFAFFPFFFPIDGITNCCRAKLEYYNLTRCPECFKTFLD